MKTLFLLSTCFLPLLAQTNVVVGAGYHAPSPIPAAPGQLISLFVRNPKTPLPNALSASAPLPSVLAGYEVSLHQTLSAAVIPAPISSVVPGSICSGISACQSGVTITVQIPFQLIPNVSSAGLPENNAFLSISQDGVAGDSVLLHPQTDSVHILGTCDSVNAAPSNSCLPAVTHLNGASVTASQPATEGEMLILYLAGLGTPTGAFTPANGVTPTAALPVSNVRVNFAFGANQPPPTLPAPRPGSTPAGWEAPVYAGLIPSYVGLYQVNVKVPALPASLPACNSQILSNLTIAIGRTASSDGIGICAAQ